RGGCPLSTVWRGLTSDREIVVARVTGDPPPPRSGWWGTRRPPLPVGDGEIGGSFAPSIHTPYGSVIPPPALRATRRDLSPYPLALWTVLTGVRE
ncbi:hypothetical protein G9A89_002956, partial [Geosiphon pyriformis]